jgi:hypothetical protein
LAFWNFSPNETEAFEATPFLIVLNASVQPIFISFQNFALCEITDRLQNPTARLVRRSVCTTSEFAQKKDARPVGERGISAFSTVFFFARRFSSAPLTNALIGFSSGRLSPTTFH